MLKLQIAHSDGTVVNFPAGGLVEADLRKMLADELTEEIVKQTLERGVGLFASSAHVERDLREALFAAVPTALNTIFYRFKDSYRPSVG